MIHTHAAGHTTSHFTGVVLGDRSEKVKANISDEVDTREATVVYMGFKNTTWF